VVRTSDLMPSSPRPERRWPTWGNACLCRWQLSRGRLVQVAQAVGADLLPAECRSGCRRRRAGFAGCVGRRWWGEAASGFTHGLAAKIECGSTFSSRCRAGAGRPPRVGRACLGHRRSSVVRTTSERVSHLEDDDSGPKTSADSTASRSYPGATSRRFRGPVGRAELGGPAPSVVDERLEHRALQVGLVMPEVFAQRLDKGNSVIRDQRAAPSSRGGEALEWITL